MGLPKAILFDWDNTLVDTWPTIHAALNHTMEQMGKPVWALEETKARVKQSMRDSFPVLFGDAWEEAAQLYQTHYRSIHLDDLQPLAGAKEVLDYLQNQPVYVALVSNKKGPNLRAEVEHLGWGGYFAKMIGAQDAAADKPDPAPVKLALEGANVAMGADVWFVGDTGIDLECAKNAGLNALLYGDVPTDAGHFDGFAFHHHVRDHAALLEWLDGQERV